MKIVINRGQTYSHMGLSHDAIMLYAELKQIKIWPELHGRSQFSTGDYPDPWRRYWLIEPSELKDKLRGALHNIDLRSRIINSNLFEIVTIDRNEEALVYAVETLDVRANAPHANMQVVSIPDDVEWVLMRQYEGGPEWVAEKHRTWGKPE